MSSFTLKMLALALMVIDHIAQFIPGMPVWMHWIGRLAAPFFIFCSIWSFSYTKNLNKYFLRLYFAGIVMSVVQWKLHIPNNFFRTLFCLVSILYLLESYQKKLHFRKKLFTYLFWQLGSIGLCIILLSCSHLSENFIAYVLAAVMGSIFYLEGGLVYVFLGILFWIFREQKKKLVVSFCLFDVILFGLTTTSIVSLSMGWLRFHFHILSVPLEVFGYLLDTVIGLPPVELGGSMWSQNYEWMLIGSLPLILLYNNKRGRAFKWFFYIIYPVHIVILWCVGNYYF